MQLTSPLPSPFPNRSTFADVHPAAALCANANDHPAGNPKSIQNHPQVALELIYLPDPLALAAGELLHRNPAALLCSLSKTGQGPDCKN